LSANVAFPESFNLSLPNSAHCLEPADRPPRRLETEEAESGIDSTFDKSAPLLDYVIEVLGLAQLNGDGQDSFILQFFDRAIEVIPLPQRSRVVDRISLAPTPKIEQDNMREIETSRLYLRQFSMDDLNDLSAIRSDPEVMRFIGAGQPDSSDQVREALENILLVWKQHGFGRWAVAHNMDKKLIGWCGLAFLDKTEEIEIGYGIAKEYWGRGFSTEAAAASIR
jgi:RimJ/RimL family protein N-acetyltransferase